MSPTDSHQLGVIKHRVTAMENDLRDTKEVVFAKLDRHRDMIGEISNKVSSNVALIGLGQVIATGLIVYFLTRGQ